MPYHVYKYRRNEPSTPKELQIFARGTTAFNAYQQAVKECPDKFEWVSIVHVVGEKRTVLERTENAPED